MSRRRGGGSAARRERSSSTGSSGDDNTDVLDGPLVLEDDPVELSKAERARRGLPSIPDMFTQVLQQEVNDRMVNLVHSVRKKLHQAAIRANKNKDKPIYTLEDIENEIMSIFDLSVGELKAAKPSFFEDIRTAIKESCAKSARSRSSKRNSSNSSSGSNSRSRPASRGAGHSAQSRSQSPAQRKSAGLPPKPAAKRAKKAAPTRKEPAGAKSDANSTSKKAPKARKAGSRPATNVVRQATAALHPHKTMPPATATATATTTTAAAVATTTTAMLQLLTSGAHLMGSSDRSNHGNAERHPQKSPACVAAPVRKDTQETTEPEKKRHEQESANTDEHAIAPNQQKIEHTQEGAGDDDGDDDGDDAMDDTPLQKKPKLTS